MIFYLLLELPRSAISASIWKLKPRNQGGWKTFIRQWWLWLRNAWHERYFNPFQGSKTRTKLGNMYFIPLSTPFSAIRTYFFQMGDSHNWPGMGLLVFFHAIVHAGGLRRSLPFMGIESGEPSPVACIIFTKASHGCCTSSYPISLIECILRSLFF